MTDARARARKHEGGAASADSPFARRSVRRFTATAALVGCACALLALLAACSDDASSSGSGFDGSTPPPPTACSVIRTPTPFCDAGPFAVTDAAAADAAADASDARADAGVAELPPEGENRCLFTSDVTIECASRVGALVHGEGKDDTSEVVIGQIGRGHATPSLVEDRRAHLSHLRVRPDGTTVSATLDPVDPVDVGRGTTALAAFDVLDATPDREAHLALATAAESETTTTYRFAPLGGKLALGAPFVGPVTLERRLRLLVGPDGEGAILSPPRNRATGAPTGEPMVLVRGLPAQPSVLTTTVRPGSFAAALSPSGGVGFLVGERNRLRLVEGVPGVDRWSGEVRDDLLQGTLDLAYVDDVLPPAALVGNTIRFLAGNAAPATLGESYSTCPRNSYIGVTCDECPVGRRCEVGSDLIGASRLFVDRGRVFVAFVATDTRQTLEYVLSKGPFVCACTREDRGKTAIADSLVVVEALPPSTADAPPKLIERMRVPLFAARTTGLTSFRSRRDGSVDVVVGRAFASFESAYGTLPEDPYRYRLLRLSLPSIP